MVLVGRPLGMYAPNFFPEQAGRDYEPSRYLKVLQPHKQDFTVISGMSHRYASGHFAEVGLFTGVHPDFIRPSDIRNSISLDQEVAVAHRRPDALWLPQPGRRRRRLEPAGRPPASNT